MSAGTTRRIGDRDERPNGIASRTYNRRAVLRAALGAAGAAALAACGGTAPASPMVGTAGPTATGVSTAGGSGAVRATPASDAGATATTTPTTGSAGTARATTVASPAAPAGKLPSPAEGVPDAWLKPPPVYQSVRGTPGRGGRITTLQLIQSPPPPPREQNRYWQELEKRLGVTYEPTLAPQGSAYDEKLAAFTASGDLPELTFLTPPASHIPVILQGAYTDLTPYLAGDARKEYPNLALFPPAGWESATYKGKLYGVPRPRYKAGNTLAFRQDWAEKVGMPQPKNAEDFSQLLTAFTKQDPDGNGQPDSFGLGSIGANTFSIQFFEYLFRVPNGWRLQDGRLTAAIETDEFRQCVTYVRRLHEAGLYFPDSATLSNPDARARFASGRFGGFTVGLALLPGIGGLRKQTRDLAPSAKVVGLVPFGHDGGAAVTYNGGGLFGFTAIPAKVGRDRERLRELLRILDYLAAPFGSEEEIFKNYGLQGVHHEMRPDDTRALTDAGRKEIGELSNIMRLILDFYYPEIPEDAAYMQDLVRDIQALGIDNPVENLYSPTAIAKGGELGQLRTDRITAVVLSREPLSALDQLAGDWRGRGGEQIRKEYEEALKG
jgi:putative aldouronate transport system substrate-binding protein